MGRNAAQIIVQGVDHLGDRQVLAPMAALKSFQKSCAPSSRCGRRMSSADLAWR
jgi:hypothetical protein